MDDKASLDRRHIFALAMSGVSLRSARADIERDKFKECTALGTSRWTVKSIPFSSLFKVRICKDVLECIQ
jgi:hypothetical protein